MEFHFKYGYFVFILITDRISLVNLYFQCIGRFFIDLHLFPNKDRRQWKYKGQYGLTPFFGLGPLLLVNWSYNARK